MNFSRAFILRPIATILLSAGLALAGIVAFFMMPVAPLPNVDTPIIVVSASMAGANPEVMASSVATPLERRLGTIADVTEMTSRSQVGSTRVVLQFGLDRDIDGAARDVQAAINAARGDLPAAMRNMPTYRKMNPSDMPIMVLALTSKTLTPGQIYDSASTILQQKLSQVSGIGQVQITGSSLPAVRIELNPHALFQYGIPLENVRAAVSAANANAPKGAIEDGPRRYQIYTNDAAATAANYKKLIIAWRNNAAVRLSDVANVVEGVEDVRNVGMFNGKRAVLVILSRQPGANIIDTVDNVAKLLPQLQAAIPASIDLAIANDRTKSIRASFHDVERTMLLSIALVVLVVFLFLRNARSAAIPAVAVPLSLCGTFGIMYLMGFTLDNLSLMALTVATGFVVDDAIVVLENVTRHIESGKTRLQAALLGAREVGFTVLSMSVSLIAVFIPILFMGGIVGRFFHEFAVTLSLAIFFSLIVSLTTTPMMCAIIALEKKPRAQGRILQTAENFYNWMHRIYERSLASALANPIHILVIFFFAIFASGYLYYVAPKGFIPSEDTGQIQGGIRGDYSISFQAIQSKFTQFVSIIAKDPAVENVTGFMGGGGAGGGGGPRGGGGGSNGGNVFIQLKPGSGRDLSTDQVIDRLRGSLSVVSGARLFLFGASSIPGSGRGGSGRYQYALRADTLQDLQDWVPRITTALENVADLEDVNSDRGDPGLEVNLIVDRSTASRLGIAQTQIDNTLYDAFGQRQIATIYNEQNQYSVVMGVAPAFWQNPDSLNDIYVSASGGAISGTQATAPVAGTTVVAGTTAPNAADVASDAARNQRLNALTTSGRGAVSTGAAVSTRVATMVPLAAFARFEPGFAPLEVNHDGPFVATTISFNLPAGVPLSRATAAIDRTMAEIHVPASVHGGFAGTARSFQSANQSNPILILVAILTVYVVLGILYESYIHPLTILSTLPSAGMGAVLALMITGSQLDLIGLIGIILLIGIVKKNAIMMVDFALVAEREEGLSSRDAIYKACLLRFRPIMMTSFAAILGSLPLALGLGAGSEVRQPLGIAVVGGLIVSQLLTLYTTPVIYLYMERLRIFCKRKWNAFYDRFLPGRDAPQPAE